MKLNQTHFEIIKFIIVGGLTPLVLYCVFIIIKIISRELYD